MICQTLLEKIGFSPEDIVQILQADEPCADPMDALASEYMAQNGLRSRTPYTSEEFNQKRDLAQGYLLQTKALCSHCSYYMAQLLFWLHCVPHAEKYYREKGISETVFWDSMYDLVCKTQMCKKNYGTVGVYLDWFYLIFDYLVFSLGRLQFYVEQFEDDAYQFEGFQLKRGDTVYSCHIPANGPLLTEACMDSFQRAYDFFKDQLTGTVIPITCHSWLLYPPYIKSVFVAESNMARFAGLFDIIRQDSTGQRFLDARNVFGKFLDGDTDSLPRSTRLQQNFIQYIKEGHDFGSGYGVILYDGVKKKILNRR